MSHPTEGTRMISYQTIQVTTASGRVFEVPAVYTFNVFAVVPSYEFYTDGLQPDRRELGDYSVSHAPTGNGIAVFKSKKSARGFCMWLARHFTDYDPDNPEHEAVRKQLMGEIHSVVLSYRGWMMLR